MLPEEYAAAGRVAGEGFGRTVATIGDTHGAIAGRVFDLIGEGAKPVELTHDAIAKLAYGSTRLLGRGLLRVAGAGAGLAQGPAAPPADRTLAGRLIKGALSGAFGDALAAERNPLAVEMAVRRRGADVAPAPEALAAAFPRATPRLAVFLHGLCETEDAWGLAARGARTGDGPPPPSYGARLRDELGFTPIYVRYNSGLHISVNGRRLASLLEELVGTWPVEVEEIALVGHSMGALVARGACHYAVEGGWRERVRHVFMLGCPHKGAPIELAVKAVRRVAARVPEVEPFAAPILERSVGVTDLAHGHVVDEDWLGHDPDALWAHPGTDVPFLETAAHYFVAATISRDPGALGGRLLGDLVVGVPSAWGHEGRGRPLQFPLDRYACVGGVSHFELVNHPAVYQQLRRWLSAPRQLPAPASATVAGRA